MPKICPRCGAENPDPARYCRRCGSACDEVTISSATRLTPLLRQWRSISHKLTRKDIRRLLGEPAKLEVPAPDAGDPTETWTYQYAPAAGGGDPPIGKVFFWLPDGRVAFWTEPDWNRFADSSAPNKVAP